MPVFARQAANSYFQTEVQSRTPLELVVMLYDGALRFIAQARGAIERNDIRARRDAIARTQAILSELQSTLNMEKGEALAKQLDSLYVYIGGRLMDASFKQDVRPIDEATKLLTTLRDAWADVARNAGSSAAQAAR
jgi:flagellar secretion chaperone FliS